MILKKKQNKDCEKVEMLNIYVCLLTENKKIGEIKYRINTRQFKMCIQRNGIVRGRMISGEKEDDVFFLSESERFFERNRDWGCVCARMENMDYWRTKL